MSAIEIKSEVIRLVNEMDENLMEDLLSSIRVFIEQQEHSGTDTNTPDILKSLSKSLNELKQGQLLSNEEVEQETKKWLTR
jgi:hypothetical protein